MQMCQLFSILCQMAKAVAKFFFQCCILIRFSMNCEQAVSRLLTNFKGEAVAFFIDSVGNRSHF